MAEPRPKRKIIIIPAKKESPQEQAKKPAFIDLFTKEFKALTEIGNSFTIRHHETNKIEIPDLNYYDYFFNRCLSLIALAVEYLQ